MEGGVARMGGRGGERTLNTKGRVDRGGENALGLFNLNEEFIITIIIVTVESRNQRLFIRFDFAY